MSYVIRFPIEINVNLITRRCTDLYECVPVCIPVCTVWFKFDVTLYIQTCMNNGLHIVCTYRPLWIPVYAYNMQTVCTYRYVSKKYGRCIKIIADSFSLARDKT